MRPRYPGVEDVFRREEEGQEGFTPPPPPGGTRLLHLGSAVALVVLAASPALSNQRRFRVLLTIKKVTQDP